MTKRVLSITMFFAASAALLFTCPASDAADWPMWRHDAGRSSATTEQLPAELHLQWTRDLPSPKPAFPGEVRLRFDESYEPIVLGKTMFISSMVTDCITALDTETGAERWRLFTGGPVRFAPVAWQGRVYAASDDGFLYCLDAETGELQWKFRGLPEDRNDRKLMGNQRLISLWPARGGPVLQDGIIYFAAGIWPADGVFIHAIDATTGKTVWSNTTSNQIPKANQDHGIGQYAGLTPQGYLALIGDKLVVPCGAQLPAFLDRKTGVLGEYMMGWGGRVGLPKGSWFVAGAGKYMSHSGDLYDITRPNDETFRDPRAGKFKHLLYPGGFTRLQIDPTNQRALGSFNTPVMTETAMYYRDSRDGIVAYDLTKIALLERGKIKPAPQRAGDQYPDKWKGDLQLLWKTPSALNVHIKAGSRLYLGGPNVVQALDIPSDGQPKVSWQAEIQGTPHSMVAANGKLFVTTRSGRLYAFGGQAKTEVVEHKPAQAALPADGDWTKKAADILAATDNKSGCALVLGIENGRLVEELLRQSQLYVIAVDSREGRVADLRKRLHRAGLYGTRTSVHVGDPASYPFPPYLANVVVSEDHAAIDHQQLAKALVRSLRPYGGVALIDIEKTERARVRSNLEAAKPEGAVVDQHGDVLKVVRHGGLPGAADWSHVGANAANASASQDRFLKAPLGMLWFDGSIRWHRKPGSAVIRVSGGRVFVKADDLIAIDVYTGRHHWRTKLPVGSGGQTELVAVEDAVYLAGGRQCFVLDPASGQETAKIEAPAGTSGSWSNIRVWKDYLVGAVGKHLVCLDRHTGKARWQYECGRPTLSVAAGGGRVFCAELVNQRRGGAGDKLPAKTRALNVESGDVLWENDAGWTVHYSEPFDLLVTSGGIFSGKDGSRIRTGIPAAQIAGEQLISGTTDSFTVYDLQSGVNVGDALKWNRRGCTGLRSSCNLVTTRFKANAAYVDLATREITPLWNIRSGCSNNLFPANGILNVPNVTGGCECNYTPVSKAFAPASVIDDQAGGR